MNRRKCLFIVLAFICFSQWACLPRQALTLTERDTITTVRIDTVYHQPPPSEGEQFSLFENFFDTLEFEFPTHTTTVEIERDWEEGKEKIRLKNIFHTDTIYHECTDTIFIEKTTMLPGVKEGGGFPFSAVALALVALYVWWNGKRKSKKAEAAPV